jgi:ParB family transcriptional regulator, chromosome partitioning protein
MATVKPDVQYLPVDEIEPSPDNPRTAFDGDLGDLTELTELIKAQGVLQHLVVCPKRDGRYPLVFGERRLAAAKLAGLTEVPAEIRDYDDAERFAAMYGENFGREGLTPLQEAFAYQRALERKGADGKKLFTQRTLAPRLGVGQAKVSKYTAIFKLPEHVIGRLKDGRLTITQAINLLPLAKDPARVEAALRDFDQHPDVDMETVVRKQQADLEREAKVTATLKELQAAGARIAADDWRDQGGKKLGDGYYELDMPVEEHALEPCHAAIVTYHGEVAYVCTEPDRHRPAEEPPADPPQPPAAEDAAAASDEQPGAQTGEANQPDPATATAAGSAPARDADVAPPADGRSPSLDVSPTPPAEELEAKRRMEEAREAARKEQEARERAARERAEQLRAASEARTSALQTLLGGRLSRPAATRLLARFLVHLTYQSNYYDDSYVRQALRLDQPTDDGVEPAVLAFAAKSDDTLLRTAVAVLADHVEELLDPGEEPDFLHPLVVLYYQFLTAEAAYKPSELERTELGEGGDAEPPSTASQAGGDAAAPEEPAHTA